MATCDRAGVIWCIATDFISFGQHVSKSHTFCFFVVVYVQLWLFFSVSVHVWWYLVYISALFVEFSTRVSTSPAKCHHTTLWNSTCSHIIQLQAKYHSQLICWHHSAYPMSHALPGWRSIHLSAPFPYPPTPVEVQYYEEEELAILNAIYECLQGVYICSVLYVQYRRPYNLYCVGEDVKPCSINQLYVQYMHGISFKVLVCCRCYGLCLSVLNKETRGVDPGGRGGRPPQYFAKGAMHQ